VFVHDNNYPLFVLEIFVSNAVTTTTPTAPIKVMTLGQRFNTIQPPSLADIVEQGITAVKFADDLKERIAVPLDTPFLFDAYTEYAFQVGLGRTTASSIRRAFERLDRQQGQ